MKIDVINLDNKKVGDLDLADEVFGGDVRADILHRVVRWQLAARQAGTHKVKGRNEINGTTKKPYKQKGTGSARRGDRKSPHHRGGGVAMGPVVRSHAHKLPKKVRALGLRSALAAKAKDGKLIVIDEAALAEAKTSALSKKVAALGWTTALVIDGSEVNEGFARAASNIVGLDVLPSQGANVYDILRRDTLVLTKAAVEKLEERLK